MFQGDEPIYDIIIPGREIPKWFRHQSVGTSMSLQVPLDKLKGVAMCVVFVLRQHHPLHQLRLDDVGTYKVTHWLRCYLKADIYERDAIIFPFSEEFGKIESCHLFLGYYPYKSFDQELKENWSQVDANGFNQIEIGFETEGLGLEVTKCGGRWVYEQDIEDLNQIMHGCNENDLEDSAKDTKTE